MHHQSPHPRHKTNPPRIRATVAGQADAGDGGERMGPLGTMKTLPSWLTGQPNMRHHVLMGRLINSSIKSKFGSLHVASDDSLVAETIIVKGWSLNVLRIVRRRRSGIAVEVRYRGEMVYVETWDEFLERSVQLFRADPEATRYQTKYRHSDGKLVAKVTDNKECIKYKTDQAQDLKKLEKLNNMFFTLMARGPEADLSEVSGTQQAESQPVKRGRGRKQ